MHDSHQPRSGEALVRAIIEAEYAYKKDANEPAPPVVVTLYRDHGAGGEHIAQLLSQRLGIPIYDQEILERVADAAHVDKALMAELDDKVCHDKSSWVRGLFTTNTAYPASYRRYLVDVILDIAEKGGIIIGRGAHIILSDREVFRLRIVGSVQRCAERLAGSESISVEAAREQIAEVNSEHAGFLSEMFHENPDDPSLYDLVINTDRIQDLDAATDLILLAMMSMGFPVPESES